MVKSSIPLNNQQMITGTILLASLGYFVDIYDLILFSIVRIKSLESLGLTGAQLLDTGVYLLNMQMIGMLIGGLIWGMLGDKKGRLSVLLGSIFLYSLANIANAFVDSVEAYAIWRFIAGIGLAGELGAGITLVAEAMPKDFRAYGTVIVSAVGILGAIAAALIGDLFDWRTAYIIGGVMGFVLLLLRIKVGESLMFAKLPTTNVKRGSLLTLFSSWKNSLKYINCILIGIPLWYVVGILITFSPEFGRAFKMVEIPSPGKAIMFTYIGLSLGGLLSGFLSQYLQSRKKATAIFMALNFLFILMYLFCHPISLNAFYLICFALGIASGYWAIFVTIAAEQFGTNIRATVATTVPNVVRGSVVPLTLTFQALNAKVGVVQAGLYVGLFCVAISFISLLALEETHGKNLDYHE